MKKEAKISRMHPLIGGQKCMVVGAQAPFLNIELPDGRRDLIHHRWVQIDSKDLAEIVAAS